MSILCSRYEGPSLCILFLWIKSPSNFNSILIGWRLSCDLEQPIRGGYLEYVLIKLDAWSTPMFQFLISSSTVWSTFKCLTSSVALTVQQCDPIHNATTKNVIVSLLNLVINFLNFYVFVCVLFTCPDFIAIQSRVLSPCV